MIPSGGREISKEVSKGRQMYPKRKAPVEGEK